MVAGHLQEKNGLFYIVLCYRYRGKTQKKWISTGLHVKGNKRIAENMLAEARRTFVTPDDKEELKKSADMAFIDFMKLWLSIAKSTIKLTTYSSYESITNKIIIPYFKDYNLTLSEVEPYHIQGFYLKQLERVSANTVIRYHSVIHRAFKYAVKTRLISSNPVDLVDRPKKEVFRGSFYSEEEIKELFEAARGTKMELPVMMASFYGLRRSEIIGLKWDAFDFVENTITIKHTLTSCIIDGKKQLVAADTTKTKSSMRTLPLVPQFREILLKRLENQKEWRRVCGKSYNKEYLDYVCVDEMGNLLEPEYVTQNFASLLKKNELRHIRFHDLRHTCASLLLKNGVPMKQIQEWLGHSDFSTTANIYAHLDYAAKLNSAQAMLGGMNEALSVIQ